MILAHHLIFTLYAWWLPNDPRGSSSHTIRCDVIAELGELHSGRKKVQPSSRHIREFYENARQILKHELRVLQPDDLQVVAHAFERVIRNRKYTCYPCAIMPDHIHLVIRKHRDHAEQMIKLFQDASREAICSAATWPPDHPVWGGPGWKVFLDSADDIRRTVRYVEQNPSKIRLPAQS